MKRNVLEQQSHNNNWNVRVKAHKAVKGLEELVKMYHKWAGLLMCRSTMLAEELSQIKMEQLLEVVQKIQLEKNH